MSGSRRGADNAQSNADANSNSVRKQGSTTGVTSASQPGNSATLTGTGQATLNSGASSNIPMAEPNVDINRSERLFP